jgi:hypothetical protein
MMQDRKIPVDCVSIEGAVAGDEIGRKLRLKPRRNGGQSVRFGGRIRGRDWRARGQGTPGAPDGSVSRGRTRSRSDCRTQGRLALGAAAAALGPPASARRRAFENSSSPTFVPIPTGENVIFVMTRRTERGPVERTVVQKLDELRPYLARSALMSARLQLERARIASETLAVMGLPALVIDERGKVLAANHLMGGGAHHPASFLAASSQSRLLLGARAPTQTVASENPMH